MVSEGAMEMELVRTEPGLLELWDSRFASCNTLPPIIFSASMDDNNDLEIHAHYFKANR